AAVRLSGGGTLHDELIGGEDQLRRGRRRETRRPRDQVTLVAAPLRVGPLSVQGRVWFCAGDNGQRFAGPERATQDADVNVVLDHVVLPAQLFEAEVKILVPGEIGPGLSPGSQEVERLGALMHLDAQAVGNRPYLGLPVV